MLQARGWIDPSKTSQDQINAEVNANSKLPTHHCTKCTNTNARIHQYQYTRYPNTRRPTLRRCTHAADLLGMGKGVGMGRRTPTRLPLCRAPMRLPPRRTARQ